MDNISREHDVLKQEFTQQTVNIKLLGQIDQWEQNFMNNIKHVAQSARTDTQKFTKELSNHISTLFNNLSEELELNRKHAEYDKTELNEWNQKLEEIRLEISKLLGVELVYDDNSQICSITIKVPTNQLNESLFHEIATYRRVLFGVNQSTNADLVELFKHLANLNPMDKHGSLSGRCVAQTDQMIQFLSETFDFKNIPNKDIIDNVQAFQLNKLPNSLPPTKEICFPSVSEDSFKMTVKEIMNWQRSYRIYVDNNILGINKNFIKQALQGNTKDGEEAFRMKFMVRISTCPILMDFDGKIISRQLNEDWPNRIKLVSATGIDLAGQRHDIDDIRYYLLNWKEIFVNDQRTGLPIILNENRLSQAPNKSSGKLHEERVRHSLMRMIRLRLTACDEEGVKIVVETGVGLGEYAGSHINVASKMRKLTAETIRTILQRDGSTYKNIRAVIFALPVFNSNKSTENVADSLDHFINEFQQAQYNGPIPVFIVDQDIHRLTVAIARLGFTVSELCPTDSYSVFGAFWQNRMPAFEEKVALTTLGLLVQHHLINK